MHTVFQDCFLDDSDTTTEAITVEHALTGPVGVGGNDGGQGTLRFSKARIAEEAERIAFMLSELPTEFRTTEKGGGGGWSFLNACMDRHGNQWTGMHMTMAQLFALGQAAGLVDLLLPPEMWPALPGGVPYYAVKVG